RIKRNHLIITERRLNLSINKLRLKPPRIITIRLLPHRQREQLLIRQPASDQRRRIPPTRTIKAESDNLTLTQRDAINTIPQIARLEQRIRRRNNLIQVHPLRLRHRARSLHRRRQKRLFIQPHTVATNLRQHSTQSTRSHRHIRISLKTVIVNASTAPLLRMQRRILDSLEVRLTRTLQHRILARLESVRDHQLPGQPERALSNVAVDRFRQVQAIIPRNPVLNLVLDSERSRAALRGTERRRQNRNVSTTTKRGNRHLTNINPELGNHRLREQPARLLQRRLRLSLRNRRTNDRRRMMRTPHRLTGRDQLPVPTVPAQLDPGQRHTERFLTPALKPLHHQLVPLEPARHVQRIQRKPKPPLLNRKPERLASIIHIP